MVLLFAPSENRLVTVAVEAVVVEKCLRSDSVSSFNDCEPVAVLSASSSSAAAAFSSEFFLSYCSSLLASYISF
jgi:hypothetical protein